MSVLILSYILTATTLFLLMRSTADDTVEYDPLPICPIILSFEVYDYNDCVYYIFYVFYIYVPSCYTKLSTVFITVAYTRSSKYLFFLIVTLRFIAVLLSI